MIIIDENIDQCIVDEISSSEYEYFAIRDESPGIKDRDVIDIAIRENALLLTEDKDFGRLVFAYNIKGCSVLLIRYEI